MEIKSSGNVAVVDDDPFMLYSVSALLRSRGFTVCSYCGGHEALKGLLENPADLVLADVNMPQMNGLALMARIRAVDPDTPVIFMTGNAEIDLALTAVKMRVFEIFLKPFHPMQLLRSIENGIKLKRDLAENRLVRKQPGPALRIGSRLPARPLGNSAMSSEVIKRLAAAAELRDDETGQHLFRIGIYAGLVARALGMPEDFVEMIELAAPMHDIGKIGIPDCVLLKPASLTPAEFETIKTHTIIGERLLCDSSDPLLQMAAAIALTHHERWDGSGYPFGLAGEEIPLAGRIVMMADQYDALRSRRVYKRSLDHAATCAILLEGDDQTRPDHFDPSILAVFSQLEPRFAEAFALHGAAVPPAHADLCVPRLSRSAGG